MSQRSPNATVANVQSRIRERKVQSERIAWRYSCDIPGPTTVFVAAMHGNERMGLEAVKAVFEELHNLPDDVQQRFSGRVFGVVGNLSALDTGVRHVDADLNRLSSYIDGAPPQLEALPSAIEVEAGERRQLLNALREILQHHNARYEAVVLDLHTSSSTGPPFVTFSDTLRNRRFAEALPTPFILGLTERLPGTLMDYLTAAGCISLALEMGQHDDPEAALLHRAALRIALVRAGHIDPDDLPGLHDDIESLRAAAKDLPAVLDVQFRHGLEHSPGFAMRPGYKNLQPVAAGEHLADDDNGPILAPRTGRILLPLYQKQGMDGFFIARPISRIWLRLSRVLRRVGAVHLLRLLPGVRQHPSRSESLLVNSRVARYLAVDVFHLFGYRFERMDNNQLQFSRRQHDFAPPPVITIDTD